MKRVDILFIMPSLNRGGAEGVIVNIVNNLDREKFNIKLMLFQNRGDLVANLRDDIRVYILNSNSVSLGMFRAVYKIYTLNPDIVFSGISNLNIYLSLFIPVLKLFRKDIKFVARQASILSLNNKQEKAPRIYELLHKSVYKNYDLVICQSKYMRDDLISNYKFPFSKCIVINNPIDIDSVCKKALERVDDFPFSNSTINLISVGNLRYEKRFDLLLKSFSLLNNRYRLIIIGDGIRADYLKKLAKSLKIEKRVAFLGYKSNPYPYIKRSDIFVLTSEYEGFPNVVLEANLLGLFVVGFKSVGGVTEIIKDGLNGRLVEFGDIKRLADAIKRVDISLLDRKAISKSAYRFSLREIIKIYEKSLEGLL